MRPTDFDTYSTTEGRRVGLPLSPKDDSPRLVIFMEEASELTFSNGLTAHAFRVHRLAELSVAPRELGLRRSSPTLVVVGGAGGLSDGALDLLRPLFVEVLAPLAEAVGASVVDGGTDAGVMRLISASGSLQAVEQAETFDVLSSMIEKPLEVGNES